MFRALLDVVSSVPLAVAVPAAVSLVVTGALTTGVWVWVRGVFVDARQYREEARERARASEEALRRLHPA